MKYLLDTCAFLFLINDPSSLSEAAQCALREEKVDAFLSVISVAEISIKEAKGKLRLPLPILKWTEKALKHHSLKLLPLDLIPCTLAGQLPWVHSDPFDRLLIATALQHRLTLITADKEIQKYPNIRTLW